MRGAATQDLDCCPLPKPCKGVAIGAKYFEAIACIGGRSNIFDAGCKQNLNI